MSICFGLARTLSRWKDNWSGRISSFSILELMVRAVGRERTVGLYYGLVYWWTGGIGLTGFNYGYAPVSDAVTADIACKEPFQIELYRQIAVALDPARLRGGRVLEISCGLGGGFDYLSRHCGIGYGVVLDRSLNALRWARRRFTLRAIKADARMLPLADGSFDVIINVEASHNYFSDEFIAEVARLLAPNGLLGMSDERVGTRDAVEAAITLNLARHGLDVIKFDDVTENVADACTLDAPRREALLASVPWLTRNSVRQWIGLENSLRYRQFRARNATYFILVAQRRSGPPRNVDGV